ncbi:MAG TPA: hypothetical protein VF916_09305, partial [Ktedonobacterales bacterium]
AHPVFFYGQDYMGALQAYLAAPVFAVLGPTTFALHVTTTVQFALFALVLYAFTRAVYSPKVAWLTIALLALGPSEAFFLELRAGAGIQDTLFFGTLLFWLAFLRLQRPGGRLKRALLDAGLGLTAGLGVWADLLILPFLLAAGLALAGDMLWRLRGATSRQRVSEAASQLLTLAPGFGLACAPFIAANIASRGATFARTLSIAGTGSTAGGHAGIADRLIALGDQVAVTLFLGLPHALGSAFVCVNCATWPTPRRSVPLGEALHSALISAPFSLVALAFWALAAVLVAREVWQSARGTRLGIGLPSATSQYDARWWGRAMLIISATLTVVAYMASHVAYFYPGTDRYLAGIYVSTPLVAEPLYQGGALAWRWIAAQHWLAGIPQRPPAAAFLAAALLVALFGLDVAAIRSTFLATDDRQVYGVPAGTQDRQLVSFLHTHHAASFYTTYWVCDRLMFESAEETRCAVVKDGDIFSPGLNRVSGNWAALRAMPHPAYVFDTQTEGGLPIAEHQVAALFAAGDSRFTGYVTAQIAGYVTYYYDHVDIALRVPLRRATDP